MSTSPAARLLELLDYSLELLKLGEDTTLSQAVRERLELVREQVQADRRSHPGDPKRALRRMREPAAREVLLTMRRYAELLEARVRVIREVFEVWQLVQEMAGSEKPPSRSQGQNEGKKRPSRSPGASWSPHADERLPQPGQERGGMQHAG